jgi:hypothetical protein
MIVTLNPSADAAMISDGANTNYGSETRLWVGEQYGATSLRRSLIKFDLSAYSGQICSSAKLRIYDTGTDLTNNTRNLIIYRVKRNWGGATVTWNKYDGTNSWTTAGCGSPGNDYDNNLVGSVSLPNPPSAGYIEVTITPSYINEWLSGSLTNYGFCLYTQSESDDMHEFYSNDNASNKPELVLTFKSAGYFHMSV